MVNYQNGKIYRLVSGSGTQYVGATTIGLAKRKSQHKRDYTNNTNNNTTSIQLFQEDNGVEIFLIEKYACSSKEELDSRERYWIENIQGGCVNKFIPGRSKREYIEQNREHILEQKKKYRQANREIILEKSKNYYEANREIILDKEKKKISCECGVEIRRDSIYQHRKSQKHKNLLQEINDKKSNELKN